jgi:hypothetical protein
MRSAPFQLSQWAPGPHSLSPPPPGKLEGGEKFVQRLEEPLPSSEAQQPKRKMNSPRSETQAEWTPSRPQDIRSGLSDSRQLP